MKNFIKISLFIFFLILFYGCSEQKTVFILSSYDNKDVCGQPQVEGATDALKKNVSDLKIQYIYLDSRRISQQELEKRCDDFVKSVKFQKPSLILTTDDAAFQCAAKHFMGDKIPVVFSGINLTPQYYNAKYHFMEGKKPIKNFTGIYEKIFILKQIEMIEVLVGKIDKIAVLYSNDFMGNTLKEQVVYELNKNFKDKMVFYPTSSIQELIKASEEINKRKDIIAYFPFVMLIENEKIFTISELASIITDKIKKIDLAINRQFVELGFFGGICVDFYQMGYKAGEMASYILKTGKISNLEVEDVDKYIRIINLKRARDINFKISEENLSLFDEVIR